MTAGQKLTLAAPAKINLGLEVLGRRTDGYHEIRTVLAMVSLCDTLTVADQSSVEASPAEGVNYDENLIARALAAYRTRMPRSPELGWTVEKRIPLAAGLGGASSDAAAMLRAANAWCPNPLDDRELHDVAAGLGSDVPFFLDGPAAVASGRGTELVKVESPRLELLLVVPHVALGGKTRLLYSLLQSSDCTNGTRISEVIDAIGFGCIPTSDMLHNAFSRALCDHVPRIQQLQDVLRQEIGLPWGLSGAGPGHYVIAGASDHGGIRNFLKSRFPGWLRTFSVNTLDTIPETICDPRDST